MYFARIFGKYKTVTNLIFYNQKLPQIVQAISRIEHVKTMQCFYAQPASNALTYIELGCQLGFHLNKNNNLINY